MKSNFDVALEKAFESEFSWLDNFENPYADYQFSSQFEANMQHILSKSKSQYSYVSIGKRRVRKLLVVTLVALLAIAITGCAFAVHYIIEWNETQNEVNETLSVTFDTPSNQSDNTTEAKLPVIPDGFEITDQYGDDTNTFIDYANSEGEQISFSRCGELENMSVSIDNGSSPLEEISINGYKGYTYIKDNINILYWTDSSYFYILQCTCDKSIIISMAESMDN